jgi:hypothetical protein
MKAGEEWFLRAFRNDCGDCRARWLRFCRILQSPVVVLSMVVAVALMAWLTLAPQSASMSVFGNSEFSKSKLGVLPPPHGRKTLVDLLVTADRATELKAMADLPQWPLSLRQVSALRCFPDGQN